LPLKFRSLCDFTGYQRRSFQSRLEHLPALRLAKIFNLKIFN